MISARSIAEDFLATSCYFRTTVDTPYRKALVQINEDCNLRCAHCFVSATRVGKQMPLADVVDKVIPRLAAARVRRITLTGGEPTIHPDFMAIVRAFRDVGMDVGICTNATNLDDQEIGELAGLGVHCNVSLDGFAADSHGKFRGDRASFAVTVAAVEKLGAAGILQGLLCTPNSLAQNEEYAMLCAFARENEARYVLLNPLGSMGRGVKSQGRLAKTTLHMQEIHALIAPFDGPELDIAHIRFPNTEGNRCPAARPGRSSKCSPPVRSPCARIWSSPHEHRPPSTPTTSSSSGISSPTQTSRSAWTTIGSTTATRSARTPPAGRAR
ncbi:MAG: radical SAM protein [Pseudonocardia sp.]